MHTVLEISSPSPESKKSKFMKHLVSFTATNFKQHENLSINFREGVSVLAGANNAGKSSLLQAIGVWEFCKTVLISERGPLSLLPVSIDKQGIGVEYNNFTAISIPSFKHLWTNLQSSIRSEDSGYSLTLEMKWRDETIQPFSKLDVDENLHLDPDIKLQLYRLKFGLSLANNTLFIKLLDSNIREGQDIIRAVYLPPISSVKSHEEKLNIPARRRKIGEGLAGDVLRNILFDHYIEYEDLRKNLLLKPNGQSKKLSATDKRIMNKTAWKKITNKAEELFSIDIIVDNYIEEYHSFIDIKVVSSEAPSKAKRWQRDIMFEGSGFIQWVCVFAFSYSTDNDILLLDEPDSHLHPLLQKILISELDKTSNSEGKSILVSSHSPEILKGIPLHKILRIYRENRKTKAKYLSSEIERKALLEGIGTSYFERIYKISTKQKIIFHEGKNDKEVILACAKALGESFDDWVFWENQDTHTERLKLFDALKQDFPNLIAVSIRDRDELNVNQIDTLTLIPKGDDKWKQGTTKYIPNFLPQTYIRKELESYFIHPRLIAKSTKAFSQEIRNTPPSEKHDKLIELVSQKLADRFGLVINDDFFNSEPSLAVLDIEGKKILQELQAHNITKILNNLSQDDIAQDLRKIITNMINLKEQNSAGGDD